MNTQKGIEEENNSDKDGKHYINSWATLYIVKQWKT